MSKYDELHLALVNQTCKDGQSVIQDLNADRAHLIHMLMGIVGEAGELMDAIKKHTIYNKPLDRENVIEELGDIEWYMQGLRAHLGISRDAVLQYNIEKLKKRYPDKYTDAHAQLRMDKA